MADDAFGAGQGPNMNAIRVPFDADFAASQLSGFLDLMWQTALHRPIVIVCVGTDRSTGDAFGPIVGARLQGIRALSGIDIYGSLDEPVHAVNLASTLDEIRATHRTPPFILAIDACLGKFDHVGHIIVERGPLRPGAGVKKSLPEFGDYTLTGVVNVCGFMEYFVLQNTRLGIVMRMTDIVVEALSISLQRHLLRETMAKGEAFPGFRNSNMESAASKLPFA